jgi:hypothetical protein
MRTTFIRLAIAIGLAIGAWVSWSEAKLADRIGDARQQIATLQYADVAADLDDGVALSEYLSRERSLHDQARVAKSTVAYWLGRYDEVGAGGEETEVDADVLLTVANAAFREAQRRIPGTGNRPFDKLRAAPSGVEGREPGTAVQQLDGVLNAYASALKASPRNIQAAYNYEFVARYRDQLARSQGKGVKPPVIEAAAMAGDLPAGPTIHGRPGAPPPDAKMEELQMLAPMEYGDREAQPEATPGGKRERKG